MLSRTSSLVAAALLSLTGHATASEAGQKIAMQGNGKGATACIACHGVNGEGQAAAGFPRLAGMNADYLVKQLNDFAYGSRSNPLMTPIAKALSDEEKTQIAQFYAAKNTPSAKTNADKALITAGEKVATRGDWDNNIPACVSCHGPAGQGVGDAFPAIAGQHASYISQQIAAWKNGTRTNDPNQLMKVVADRLTEDQVKAVSAYFASLPSSK